MKKFVIYEIINKVNNFIYVGVHKTDNVKDNYMGSGTGIKRAIKEFGKENFEKRILYIFDNKEEAIKKESEIVNEEFLKRSDVYNLTLGGGKFGQFYSDGFVNVRDKNDNCFKIKKDDPRYLSGELKHVRKNKILTIDKNGNYFTVNKNDPRYLSGELTGTWFGKKHKEETKKKIGEANAIKQKGKNNSQYGTCWIKKEKECKKIRKEELKKYLKEGWLKGRKI